MNLTGSGGVALVILAISLIGLGLGSAPDCSIFAGKKSEDDLGIHCTENCTAPMDADGSAASDGVITTNATDITSITYRERNNSFLYSITALLQALLACNLDLDKKYFIVNGWYGGNYTGLMVAAQHDLVHIAETFLTRGADPTIEIYVNNVRVNAMTVAASKNVFAVLVDNWADRNEAFHAAVSRGYADIVANLLDKGANIDDQEKGNTTALMKAALFGNEEVLTLLIEKGANMNLQCKEGNTALMYSLFIIDYSRSNKLDSCFITLLQHGADVGIKNLEGKTIVLQISNDLESYAMYYQALVDYGANINDKDNNGRTALMLAAEYGNYLGVAKLIELGADVNAQDLDGNTALIWSVKYGYGWKDIKQIVSLLLESGSDPNIRNNKLMVPLLFAAEHKYGAGVIAALAGKGADVNVYDDEGVTALMYAAKHSFKDDVNILLNHGADINLQSKSGMTALHFAELSIDLASQNVHREMHLYLLDRGADTLIRDKNGFTAAQLAYEKMFYSRQLLGIW